MILANLADGHISMVGCKAHPYVAVLTLKKATGATEDLFVTFRPGLRFEEIRVSRETVDFSVASLPLAKEKLRQGEHHSPPKGYPTDKEDYAVPEYYEFPIDRKHIKAALSYFHTHKFRSSAEKRSAAKRILARAKKYGIDVSKHDDVVQAAKG